MRKVRNTYRGFTLIEILVVVFTIAILAGVIFGSFQLARDKGGNASREADMDQLKVALKVYRNINGEFPATDSENPGSLSALDLEVLVPQYINTLPNDPLSDGTMPGWSAGERNAYYYWNLSDGPPGDCTPDEVNINRLLTNAQYVIWYHLDGVEENSGNAPDCLSLGLDEGESFIVTG